MKKLIICLCLLLVLPLAQALQECQRTQLTTQIPCVILSTWRPASCAQFIYVYNTSTNILQNITWLPYGLICNATWNITQKGTYYYNSTIESGVITVVGDDKMIFILFIPLALSFFFVYWATSLNEEQEALKWFMRLISLLMIVTTYAGANMYINLNSGYDSLQSLFTVSAATWFFYTAVAAFIVYFIYKIFMSFKHKRKDDFESGVLR